MSDTAQNLHKMYCHECHHEWQRLDEEDIKCPQCWSMSTEIVTPDNDPRHFHGRQTQRPESASTPAPAPVFYGPERPPSATPTQSQSRPSSTNSSQGDDNNNNNTHRPAHVIHQFVFAPVTFHFTVYPGQASHQPQSQSQEAPTTQEQQGPLPGAWTFFMPPFHAPPPPPPADTTSNNPPAGSAEGASQATQSQPEAQSSAHTEGPTQPHPENGQQQSQQTPRHRPIIQQLNTFLAASFLSFIGQGAFPFGPNPDAVYSQEAFDRLITQLREAEANSGGAPPASQSALDKLQTKEVDDEMLGSEENPKCVICVDEMAKGEKATILPCNHLFHGECVTHWLKQHNTCPVCRRSIEEGVNAKPAKAMDEFQTHDHHHEHQHAANSMTDCM
ncbi:hypothetical protein V8F20_004980 [Naviculisporaceae sp. PSN 640]